MLKKEKDDRLSGAICGPTQAAILFFFLKYDVAEIVADICADISAGMCADICAGMCADICTGICAETLPRLFTRNDCRVHCRAGNPQPRFFYACFFAGIPAAIEVSYYSET